MPTPILNFTPTENPLAYELYQKLVKSGARPEQLDVGSVIPNISGTVCNNDEKICPVGKGDGFISAEEIFDFAFKKGGAFRHSLFGPDKYQSWELDDRDPKTRLDQEVRRRVDQTVKSITTTLAGQGIKRHTPSFDHAMATALTLLVILPNPQRIAERGEEAFNALTGELADLGLHQYREQLRREGGFGLKNEKTGEHSALTALALSEGDTMECSRILYGVLKQAGLAPFFVWVVPQKGENPKLDEFLQKKPNTRHISVGLVIGGKTRLMDPSLLLTHAVYDHHFPLTEIQFEAITQTRRGLIAMHRSNNLESAETHLQRACRLFPSSGELQVNLAINLFVQKKREAAFSAVNRALALAPNLDQARILRARFNAALEKWENVVADLEIVHAKKDLDADIRELLGGAHAIIGKNYLENGVFDKALESLTRSLELDPTSSAAYLLRAVAYLELGKSDDARRDLVEFARREPIHAGFILTEIFTTIAKVQWVRQSDPMLDIIFHAETGANLWEIEAVVERSRILWEAGLAPAAMSSLEELELRITKPKIGYSSQTKNIAEKMFAKLPEEIRVSQRFISLLMRLGFREIPKQPTPAPAPARESI